MTDRFTDKGPVAATLDSGLKASNDAANFGFSASMRRIVVGNSDTVNNPVFYIRIKGDGSSPPGSEASLTSFHLTCKSGEYVECTLEGEMMFKTLSVYCNGTLGSADKMQCWGVPAN